jgi:hypothetical protein
MLLLSGEKVYSADINKDGIRNYYYGNDGLKKK